MMFDIKRKKTFVSIDLLYMSFFIMKYVLYLYFNLLHN